MTITYEICVDWDMTDWAATPDFTGTYDNISNDVQTISWSRGKEVEAGNAPAATLEIRMKPGLVSKYSPVNSAGVLYGKILPWRIIRVRGTYDGGSTYYNVFLGFISKYTIDPHPERKSVSIYCTDGTDLLARQIVEQDYENRSVMTEAEAMESLLNSAGWSSSRRDLGSGGDLKYPAVAEYGGI
jgi:hypothetical protein